MAPRTLEQQLTKYLTDVHSIEEQALVQMRLAPRIAGDPEIASAFATHERETERHETLIRERLQAREAQPSTVKDLAGKLTGAGFALFARLQPDTPGKLVTHAYSYEHMELAAYDLLGEVAERAGDAATVNVAGQIRQQEQAMSERVAGLFDRAVQASLGEKGAEDLQEELNGYLSDVHAIESQATQLLNKGAKIAGSGELASTYEHHLAQTREHARLIEERLQAREASPSRLKDTGLSLGGLNLGGFFAAQPDTPAKLAGFSYAFEHLEIAAYELLIRVAGRAGDGETEAVGQQILQQERAAAEQIQARFPVALDASLRAQGIDSGHSASSG